MVKLESCHLRIKKVIVTLWHILSVRIFSCKQQHPFSPVQKKRNLFRGISSPQISPKDRESGLKATSQELQAKYTTLSFLQKLYSHCFWTQIQYLTTEMLQTGCCHLDLWSYSFREQCLHASLARITSAWLLLLQITTFQTKVSPWCTWLARHRSHAGGSHTHGSHINGSHSDGSYAERKGGRAMSCCLLAPGRINIPET